MNGTLRRPVCALITGVCFLSSACVAPTTVVRNGRPLPVSSGPAKTPCETRKFYELVPSTGFSQSSATTGGGYGWVTVSTLEERTSGFSIFRAGEVMDLPDVLPSLEEPDLTSLHMGRIQPIQDKIDLQRGWATFGLTFSLLTLAAGTGTSVAGLSNDDDTLTFTGLGLLGGSLIISLLLLIPVLVYKPTNQEKTYFELRKKLLLPKEDNIEEAARGVGRYNERVREECR